MQKILFLLALSLIILLSNCIPSRAEKPKREFKSKKEIPVPTDLDLPRKERSLRVDHYPASNEMRIDLFRPYIENLGGIYLGVGTDQNLTFIAWARSNYAYLMDFDPVVVAVNRIHLYFIEKSPTYAEYKTLWERKNKKTSLELIKKHFAGDPEYQTILIAWQVAHRGSTDVPERLRDLDFMAKKLKLKTFNNDSSDYNYIRNMIINKKIIAISGDLTGDKSMRSIGETARSLKIPIRVLYMSNAEEYFRFPENYRKNIQSLYHDEKSLVIRTSTVGSKFIGYPDGEKFEEMPFHYNIQRISNLSKWMSFRHYLSMYYLLSIRSDIEKGFSRIEKNPEDTDLKESGTIDVRPAGWRWR
ncbi:MAG: hypothetical protein OEZ34_16735 [Spirochaetia bacterium]|nr:hypothetical protein [Spirochaetia bacterium]